MAHVAQWKKEVVEKLSEEIKRHPVVAVVGIHGIPAPQMQKMRRELRGKAKVVVARNRLIKLALQRAAESVPGVDRLADYLQDQSALIFSDINPFKLYKILRSSRQKMPAKGGEIAPEDIVVPAGETSFRPGPFLSDLQKAGIPSAIEKGKIVIKKDITVVKAGEVIPREVATVLTKLEIYPLEIGMEIQATYEDGAVFLPDVLAVDTEAVKADLMAGVQRAFNLAVNAAYLTPLTVAPILTKAQMNAISLAVNAGILTRETAPIILSMAMARMYALASRLPPEALDEDLRGLPSGPQPPPPSAGGGEEPAEEKEEEREEAGEEEAVAGLGALFG